VLNVGCECKRLPFELKVPNKITQSTLEKSTKGQELKRFNSVDALFDDLAKDE